MSSTQFLIPRPSTPPTVQETLLTFALKRKMSDEVKNLLLSNPSLADLPNSIGQTPFQLAAGWPIPSAAAWAVQLLLGRTKKLSDAESALHQAAQRTDSAVLTVLLQHRPKLNLNVKDPTGRTPLQIAIISGNYENFMKLLENGAEVKGKNSAKRRDLHLACYTRNEDLRFVRELLKRGAPLNEPDDMGETPLIVTLRQKAIAKALLLLEGGADPNCLSTSGVSALSLVIQLGDDEFLSFFLSQNVRMETCVGGSTVGGSALALACENGDKLAVERVLHKGVSPRDNHLCLLRAIQNSHWDIASRLLDCGASVQVLDEKFPHSNLLCLAMQNGGSSVARKLIEKGIDVNNQDQSGQTPARIALQKMDLEMIEYLLRHGVSPLSFLEKNEEGEWTSFSSCFELFPESLLHLFVSCWEDLNPANQHLVYVLAVVCKYEAPLREALKKGFPCDCIDQFGSNPLEVASQKGNVSAVKVLLEYSKAEVNRPSKEGKTPLYSILHLISQTRARIAASQSSSPLNELSGLGSPELKETVRLLLAAGADPDFVNPSNKKTPRMLARELGLEGLFGVSSSSSSSSATEEKAVSRESAIENRKESHKRQSRINPKGPYSPPKECECSPCQKVKKKK